MGKDKDLHTYTFGDIITLYAERMALHSSKSKECARFLDKYADEHDTDVRKHIKEICAGKYPLQFILGLLEPQLVQSVRNMAAILRMGYAEDTEGLFGLVRTYLASAKKNKLLPIEEEKLLSLYKDIGRTKDVTLGYSAFHENEVNMVSRAFFAAFFAYHESEFTKEQTDSIVPALVAAIEIPRKLESDVRCVQHEDWLKYLSDKYATDFFCGKSMRQVYDKVVDTLSNSDSDITAILDNANGYMLVAALTNSGLLQEAWFDTMLLPKNEKLRLAFLAYRNSGIDAVGDPLGDWWLRGEGDANTITIARQMEKTFRDSLFDITFDTFLAENIRRLKLSNVEKTFFSPEGDSLRAELKKARRKLDKAEEDLAKSKANAKASAAKAAEMEQLATDTRNKFAGLQTKIEQQQEELRVLREQLQTLNKTLDAVQSRLAPEETEIAPEPVPEEEPEDKALAISALLAHHKIVFIGGNPNLMSKFSQKYPNAIVIPQNRVPTAEQQLMAADGILFKTDSMSHKEYTPVKGLAERRGIPCGYIGDVTNMERLETEVLRGIIELVEKVPAKP